MPDRAMRLRALVRASELLGGPERLTAHLGIGVFELTSMLQGSCEISDDTFLQVVDLLMSSGVQSGSTAAGKEEINWLAVEAFKRLTPAQKAEYVRKLAESLNATIGHDAQETRGAGEADAAERSQGNDVNRSFRHRAERRGC